MTLKAMASTVRQAVSAAVAQRLQGEARDDHAAALRSRCGDVVEAQHAVEARAELLVVADHDERRAGRLRPRRTADREKRAAGRGRAPRSARRRRSAPGAPISARAAATRCCWPTLRFAAEQPAPVRRRRGRGCPAAARASSSAEPLRSRPPPAIRRKAQRQQHVVEDRAVGQQVEHLEDDAEMLGAEAIARRIRQPRRCRCRALRGAPPTARRSRTAG